MCKKIEDRNAKLCIFWPRYHRSLLHIYSVPRKTMWRLAIHELRIFFTLILSCFHVLSPNSKLVESGPTHTLASMSEMLCLSYENPRFLVNDCPFTFVTSNPFNFRISLEITLSLFVTNFDFSSEGLLWFFCASSYENICNIEVNIQ